MLDWVNLKEEMGKLSIKYISIQIGYLNFRLIFDQRQYIYDKHRS